MAVRGVVVASFRLQIAVQNGSQLVQIANRAAVAIHGQRARQTKQIDDRCGSGELFTLAGDAAVMERARVGLFGVVLEETCMQNGGRVSCGRTLAEADDERITKRIADRVDGGPLDSFGLRRFRWCSLP